MALYLSLALLSYPLLLSSPKAFVAIHGGVGAGLGLSGRLVTVRFYCKIKFAFRTAKPSRRIRDTMARPKKKSKNRETGSEWLSLPRSLPYGPFLSSVIYYFANRVSSRD